MALPRILVGVGVLAFGLLLFFGCDVETNSARALHAKHNAAIRRLLVSLEIYKSQNGTLPTTLEELSKDDPQIHDITISDYTYRSKGIPVADGSLWLVTVKDPLETNQLIVGRLPVEVATKKPRLN